MRDKLLESFNDMLDDFVIDNLNDYLEYATHPTDDDDEIHEAFNRLRLDLLIAALNEMKSRMNENA
jgi:hypothetical protein